MSTRKKRPAAPEPAIYTKTDVTPETLFQAIGRLRKEAADEVDRLLAFLDSLEDTDVDLGIDDEPHDQMGEDDEDGVDSEPSLGWTTSGGGVGCTGAFTLDAEGDEHDGREPDVDDEPSLGSTNDHHGNGTQYHARCSVIDGEGPDCDFEPSLCGVGSHVVNGFGNDQDLEATTI